MTPAEARKHIRVSREQIHALLDANINDQGVIDAITRHIDAIERCYAEAWADQEAAYMGAIDNLASHARLIRTQTFQEGL